MLRHPGLIGITPNPAELLDWSTPDDNLTQVGQLSQRTVEDAVYIKLSTGRSLGTNLAPCPGELRNRARGPTSLYTPPGSRSGGPQPDSHR